MKFYANSIMFLLAIVLFPVLNAFAGTSAFSAANPFDLNNIEQNVFNPEPQNRYTLTITNRAKWSIHEVYVETSENQKNWGKEWLDGRVLEKDTFIEITNLKPGEYDVLFVDQDDFKCMLLNIPITKNTSWELTTKWLEDCQRKTQ